MQSFLKDLVDAACAKPRIEPCCHRVAGQGAAIFRLKVAQITLQFTKCEFQAAGHAPVKDEKVCDAFGCDRPLGQPRIGALTRHRAQDNLKKQLTTKNIQENEAISNCKIE